MTRLLAPVTAPPPRPAPGRRRLLPRLLVAAALSLAAPLLLPRPPAAGADAADSAAAEGARSPFYDLLNEQLLLIATIVGSVATLPTLIEFWLERRKRRERIQLSLEDEPVADLKPRIAGREPLLADIADLLDRARDPDAYSSLNVGNEVLIVGTALSGKKSFAQAMAREAALDRLITVHNPRNQDALAHAKNLVNASRRQRVMLLVPRIDTVFEEQNEDLLSELDALIESASERDNVLVVGTAVDFEPDGALDNLFGIKLVLPGTPQSAAQIRAVSSETRRVLVDVARFYLAAAVAGGFRLSGFSEAEFHQTVLDVAGNPAEIEDIVGICCTTAIHRRKTGQAPDLQFTPQTLHRAIGRVVVNLVAKDPQDGGGSAGGGRT
ncbi:MAG: ATP-binding protein [Planctomycetes bacterium]|nr:ATP-binding protein [Planctomycetota bacterium]